MAPDLPTTYLDYADIFKFETQRTADDLAWANANATPVNEGPWDDIPGVQIFYIGINTAGERIKLPQISSFWRYKPSSIQLADPDDRDAPHQTYYVTGRPGSIDIVRIELGPSMPGILIERPKGSQPVQSTGLIDGKDFTFAKAMVFGLCLSVASTSLNSPTGITRKSTTSRMS
ncbi:hypothetical protein ACC708_27755 [Rhizobium ruizarguesonis]